jgi:ABC-type uncharacterized transport system substrate-binding protein
MRRRDLLRGLGAASAVRSMPAAAQEPHGVRRVAYVHALATADPEEQARAAAFREALASLGWTENRNVRIEHSYAGGELADMRAHAAEVVRSAPDLIVTGSSPVTAAFRQATLTIPIVFVVVIDPLGQGFVRNLARPGGNITGFSFIDFPMIGKWLEVLKEIAPGVRRMAFLFNPDTAPFYAALLRDFVAAAATSLAAELAATPVREEAEIERVVTRFAGEPDAALIVAAEPFMNARRRLVIDLAERYRLPAIYGFPQYVAEGALISYGPDAVDIVRRSASYVDRIFKGEKPGDLPVQAPTKFQLAINLGTARSLGLAVPQSLLDRADEVIE